MVCTLGWSCWHTQVIPLSHHTQAKTIKASEPAHRDQSVDFSVTIQQLELGISRLAESAADGVSTYSRFLNARVSRPRPSCHVSSSAHSSVSAPKIRRTHPSQHAATTSAYVSLSPKRRVSDSPRASASIANGPSAKRTAAAAPGAEKGKKCYDLSSSTPTEETYF